MPHFLRVVRALARAKGPLPVLAAVVTVVAGTDCACNGFCGITSEGNVCAIDTDCATGSRCDTSGVCIAESGTGGSGGAGGAGTGGAGTGGAGSGGGMSGTGGGAAGAGGGGA